MSALTKARPRREKGSTPGTGFTYWDSLPVKGDVVIYIGAACGLDENGYVVPVSANPLIRVLGVYTNSTAYPSGNGSVDPSLETIDTTGKADGAVVIDKLKRGIFGFSISGTDPVTKADVGAVVFFEDDNTIAQSNGLGDDNNPKGGRLYTVDGGLAYVLIGEPGLV